VSGLGRLELVAATSRLDLVAPPVAELLASWPQAASVRVAPIDPSLADTAAFCKAYDVGLDVSANCVVVAGTRGGETRLAACVVLATTRADVNNVVRRRIDTRKASFAPMDVAVERTGMEYGGITPLGLPGDIPILIDVAVATAGDVIVGSGIRGSKLALAGSLLPSLPNAEVVENLARPVVT
jgi:prolyl-tRNA editing enzyme YbaK/EbsC (Cys-tRNA(Pro) deacylase)